MYRAVKTLFLVVMVGGVFLLSACSSKSAESENVVRVAFFPNITHSQALVGRAQGTFDKALGKEAKVQWKKFNSGPSEIEALLAGEIDIGYIGPGPAINGYSRSHGELQIVAGATNQGSVLVSRKGLVIKNIQELSGKRVAVPQYGNTQDLLLRALLKKAGIKEKTRGGTVDIRQVDNPDIKTLLDSGQLDAALVPEPWGSRLLKEIKANLVLDFDRVWGEGEYPSAVVIVRTEFLKKHPDLVEKWLAAHVELTDFINKNPEESQTIVNRQLKELTKKSLGQDVLDMAWRKMTINYNLEIASVNRFVQVSLEVGNLKEAPDTANLFNLELLNKVLRQKGKNLIN